MHHRASGDAQMSRFCTVRDETPRRPLNRRLQPKASLVYRNKHTQRFRSSDVGGCIQGEIHDLGSSRASFPGRDVDLKENSDYLIRMLDIRDFYNNGLFDVNGVDGTEHHLLSGGVTSFQHSSDIFHINAC